MECIDVIVEIPKGSRNKYEYDFARNVIRYDRMLFSSMQYPSDYGFVVDTLVEGWFGLEAARRAIAESQARFRAR